MTRKIYFLLIFISSSIFNLNGQILDSLRNGYRSNENDSLKMDYAFSLGYYFFKKGIYDSALYYNIKAVEACRNQKYISRELEANRARCQILFKAGKTNRALTLIDSVIEESKIKEFHKVQIAASVDKGNYLSRLGNSSKALESYLTTEHLAKEFNDSSYLSTAYNNLSVEYQLLGEEELCLEYLMKSIEIREKLNSPYLGTSYANLANSYKRQNEYNEAVKYYKKSIEYFEDPKLADNKIVCLRNLGDTYAQQLRFNKARKTLNEALALAGINDNSKTTNAMYYFLMCNILQKQGQYDSVLLFGSKVMEIIPTNVAHEIRSSNLLNMANASLSKHEVVEAVEYAENAKDLALEINSQKQLNRVVKVLLNAHGLAKNTDKVIEYAKLLESSLDSLNQIEQNKKVIALQTKYDVEKKELQIEVLNNEKQLAKANLDNAERENQLKNSMILLVCIVAALLILLAIYLFRQVSQKKKANSTLFAQKEIISNQNQEKELLLKEIHHRVKNNLQVISSLLELQAKKVSDSESEVFKEGQSRVRAMALIHEELYQSEELGEVDIKAYTAKLSRQIQSLFTGKEKVTIAIDGPDIMLDIDTAIPLGLILNELVTNAFKYGLSNNGKLLISFFQKTDGTYSLKVKDNGKGIPENFELKRSKSLGLRLVNRLSRQLYGKADFKNEKGATFTIDFKDTKQRKAVA
ncbi:MAG: tetratricopeptide repeat protein [Bacteroidia bacterium]